MCRSHHLPHGSLRLHENRGHALLNPGFRVIANRPDLSKGHRCLAVAVVGQGCRSLRHDSVCCRVSYVFSFRLSPPPTCLPKHEYESSLDILCSSPSRFHTFFEPVSCKWFVHFLLLPQLLSRRPTLQLGRLRVEYVPDEVGDRFGPFAWRSVDSAGVLAFENERSWVVVCVVFFQS